jgi:hypothetical protein
MPRSTLKVAQVTERTRPTPFQGAQAQRTKMRFVKFLIIVTTSLRPILRLHTARAASVREHDALVLPARSSKMRHGSGGGQNERTKKPLACRGDF